MLRRLAPRETASNLNGICGIVPELAGDLLSTVDTPLLIIKDPIANKSFLGCDYNRDGDFYRSPFTNKFFGVGGIEAPEGSFDSDLCTSGKLREIEEQANFAFDIYREMYYEGGISSVYLWEGDENEDDISGVVVIMKEGFGRWDSIHVFEIVNDNYKLTSTVMLGLESDNVDLGGQLMRQVDVTKSGNHLEIIGSLIEDMETKMRGSLAEVYFDKMGVIIGGIRGLDGADDGKKEIIGLVDGVNSL